MTGKAKTDLEKEARGTVELSDVDREILIKQALLLGEVKAQRGSIK